MTWSVCASKSPGPTTTAVQVQRALAGQVGEPAGREIVTWL